MGKFTFNKTQNLGIFVILTIIGIFVVINFLRGQDIFNGRTKYNAIFNNVEGLTATAPVYIRGLKVGSIESIKYDNTKDNFVVKLSIKSDYAIPNNSEAELYSADILGGKSIRINLGNSNIHAKNNDTIISNIVPDMITMLTTEIGPLKEQITVVLNNMNTTLTNLNQVLDSNAKKDIAQSLDNLKKTMANANRLSANLSEASPQIKTIVNNLAELSQALKDNKQSITSSLSNLENFTQELSESKIKETINNLNSTLSKIQDPDGTIGKLLSSDTVYKSVDSLINDIDVLVKKITENPKKYIKISVF